MLRRFLDMTYESVLQDRLAMGGRAPDRCGRREEIKDIMAAVEVAFSSGHSSEVVVGKEEAGSLASGLSSLGAGLDEEMVEVSGRK